MLENKLSKIRYRLGGKKVIHVESLNGWEDMLSFEIQNIFKKDLNIPHRIEKIKTKTINTNLKENKANDFVMLQLDIEDMDIRHFKELIFHKLKLTLSFARM